MLEWLNEAHRVMQGFTSLENLSYIIVANNQIQFILEKPKRIGWDLLKVANILNTLLSIAI